MTLLLGVDGGNSKVIALLARPDGTIVAAARRSGTADIYASPGEEAAIALVGQVFDEALAQAAATRADIDRAVFSMAGADWPEDVRLLEDALTTAGFGGPVTVVNDAIGALAGAVPTGPAVVVSIGTGAATGARAEDGSTWHSSFWQSPHGGAELAQRTLAAVVRSELGIDAPTVLRHRLLEITGDDGVGAMLNRFTARGASALPAGPMVRALFDAAGSGDAIATDVVRTHGTGLGGIAAAAARRVGIDHDPSPSPSAVASLGKARRG
ncbi:MAG: BadF/BadG/BcrA/BcrD ATPase family protein [Candidatus Limnocylindria bacterium]